MSHDTDTSAIITPVFLKVPEVALALGLSKSKVAEMVTTGEIQGTHFGRAVRVHLEDLEAFIAQTRAAQQKETRRG